MNELLRNWDAVATSTVILAAAIAAGSAVHVVLFAIIRQIGRRSGRVLEQSIGQHCAPPSRIILPAIGANLALPALDFPPRLDQTLNHLVALVMIGTVAWLVVKMTIVVAEVVLSKYEIGAGDNLRARQIYTQIQ